MEKGLLGIAAAVCVFGGCATGIGEGLIMAKAVESIGKNPDAADKIQSMAIIGAAISETCAIYCLLIAFLIIFVLGA
ncbi:MAG: F0F1 ATP synthase subunit C [Erysipelotrichaceae bacterium]|nr:F0F1 ATP synthase subunit C [Erysipelotrichaceae bacterium]